jgi:hypothetical protein
VYYFMMRCCSSFLSFSIIIIFSYWFLAFWFSFFLLSYG